MSVWEGGCESHEARDTWSASTIRLNRIIVTCDLHDRCRLSGTDACINSCVQIPNAGSHTIVWTRTTILHTLTGMGIITALPLRLMYLNYQGKATRIPRTGQLRKYLPDSVIRAKFYSA